MLLESETDLTLALGLAAGVGLVLALVCFVLLMRALAALRTANDSLSRTEIGADHTERRMFNILNAVPVALVETDTGGKFVFANRAAHQLLGRKDAELIGLRFHSATWGITYPDGRLIPPDLLPAARALRGQTVKGFQHMMINPNTRKKMLVSVTAMPITDAKGEVIGSTAAIVETESLSAPQAQEDPIARRAFDVAGVMLLALGPDAKVREINPKGAEILGAAVDDVVGKDWIDGFMPEEVRVDARAFIEAVVEGRREMPFEGEGWIVRADGERRLMAWRSTPLRDEQGRVTAILSSGEDVTERRGMERAFGENEALLHSVFGAEGLLAGVAEETEDEFRFLTSNAAIDALFGKPVTGATASEAGLAPDEVARWLELLRGVDAEGRPRTMEYPFTAPGGTPRWYLGTFSPLPRSPDGRARVSFVSKDISDRRATEQAARDSEARFRALVEATPQLVWSCLPDGACDYLSPTWVDYTGVPETAHHGLGWQEAVHPDDRERVASAWAAATQGEGPYDIEYRLRAADGGWRWFKVRGAPMRDEHGQVIRWYGVATDISEIVEARDELETRVAERTRELETSLEERRKAETALAQAQRLETVGRLTGGVAHDFNNLLTVIIGALDMIMRQADKPDRVRRLGEAALTAGRRGERLTRQLLAFSRRQEFKLETLELGPVIRGFEPLMRRAVKESAPLSVQVDPALGWARLDAVQFEAALLNLVVNADDAIAADGEVVVRADRARLAEGEVSDVPAGEYARVSVIDTGAGMSPDVAARALEPFFTTKDVGQGTGLGLAQVYGFARQSDGGVRIDSVEGRGTTVSIYLPLAEAPVREPEPVEPSDEDATCEKGRVVLLVEDDAGVRTVAENLLLELGCEVVTADDGPAALKILGTTPQVDLLMTDLVMPGGMSGVELARAATAGRPALKVLLSTGYAPENLETSDHGWEVLPKPYQAEELSQAVRRSLA